MNKGGRVRERWGGDQPYMALTPYLYECEAADYLYVLPGCLGYLRHCAGWAATKIGCFTTPCFLPLHRPCGRKQLLSTGCAAG